MSPTVSIDEDAKSRLAELQAEIYHRTGKTVTQQDLLSRLIEDAYESKSVVDSFRETTVPLSGAEKEAMRRGRSSSGTEIDEPNVDDILYGRDDRSR